MAEVKAKRKAAPRKQPVQKEDPAAGKALEEIVETGNPILMFSKKRDSKLYIDGKCCGSWDNKEPLKQIWNQIAKKTDNAEVDVILTELRILPYEINVMSDLGERATRNVAEQIEELGKSQQQVTGPTTSYHTGMGPVESLG